MIGNIQRRGSALLIVLGMMAFMVISAVAFSAYLRASRLPSSYLRRTTSSRMLVKAALAEAIEEIDAAVGNFPHPGVWNTSNNGGVTALSDSANQNNLTGSRLSTHTKNGQNSNAWLGRVYIGGTSSVSTVQQRLIPQNQTVATLTLEALAYIPPPLVNEARYYSRHSNAATWHAMGFDAGRYAFCALDVSDYFDINSLTAGEPRGSAPSSRISLSYLFEDADHTASSSGGDKWDSLFQQVSASTVPQFISLADWNLYMDERTFGESNPKIQSYFVNYVKNSANSFYNGDAETATGKDAIRRMSFVTDSWFPTFDDNKTAANGASAVKQLDLMKDENQPFDAADLKGQSSRQTYYSVMNYNKNPEIRSRLESCIPGLGFCALWDYLDENDQPLSLAIPTTERTPMICGLSPSTGRSSSLKITCEPVGNPVYTWTGTAAPGGPCHCVYKVKYVITDLPNPTLQTLVTYPFRNQRPGKTQNYSIGGRLSYFLTINGQQMEMRTRNTSDLLHLTADTSAGGPLSLSAYNRFNDAVINLPLKGSLPQPSTFSAATEGQLGAVKTVSLTPSGRVPNSIDFMEVAYEWDTVDTTAPGMPAPATPVPMKTKPDITQGAVVTSAQCYWQPLSTTGKIESDFTAPNLAATLVNPQFNCELNLNLAAWVWIKNNGTDKVVDLVPACVYDDRDLNQLNTERNSLQWGNSHLGAAYPLMRFDMNANRAPIMTFSSAGSASDSVIASSPSATALQVTPQTVYVGDPRYNHAPESWFCINDTGTLSPQEWLSNCGCKGRDGDIFMQTSDQCYLQSIYELANLPRISDFYIEGSRKGEQGWYANPSGTKVYKFPQGTFASGVNSEYMWRTYDPFVLPNGNTPGDDFDGAKVVSLGNGFKVNPYTDSTNIMMAAFANTPLEWQFAADRDRSGFTWMDSYSSSSTFNRQFAWNDYSSGGKIAWEDLANVAGTFLEEMRSTGGYNWEDVYNDLGWYNAAHRAAGEDSEYLLGDEKLLETSQQGRIWNCDKKFLYGFWHDCFATQQQLFLIFVRAEPAMMGGGAVHQTPPQLGARAMALVWRDPVNRSTTGDGKSPHRTRILFYRQFE